MALVRGKLKVFLGVSPGVGKFSHMMDDALKRSSSGEKVMVIAPTARLKHQRKKLNRKGMKIAVIHPRVCMTNDGIHEALDIAQILGESPGLVLIPDIISPRLSEASNKNRQKVLKTLLDKGCDVYTSLNVYKIDTVAENLHELTDIPPGYCIPESFLARADEIELIDLNPATIVHRFLEGDVEIPPDLKAFLYTFFSLPTLSFLRQRALDLTSHYIAHHEQPDFSVTTSLGGDIKKLKELSTTRWKQYLLTVALFLVTGGLIYFFMPVTNTPTYLLDVPLLVVVIVSALLFGLGPSLVAAIGAAFFHIAMVLERQGAVAGPPEVSQILIPAAFLLGVAFLCSLLSWQSRWRHFLSQRHQLHNEVLLKFVNEAAAATTIREVAAIAAHHLEGIFSDRMGLLLTEGDPPILGESLPKKLSLGPEIRNAANWVLQNGKTAYHGADLWHEPIYILMPLEKAATKLGVLVLEDKSRKHRNNLEKGFLQAFTRHMAAAIERVQAAEALRKATMVVEREQLRSELLASISHDLKTPLVAIMGYLSAMKSMGQKIDARGKKKLLNTAYEEAERLNRLIGNILEMGSFEARQVQINRGWVDVQEFLVLLESHIKGSLNGHPLTLSLTDDLPALKMDTMLVEQVFTNVVSNAVKYTPDGAPINISARSEGDEVVFNITDNGHGIPDDKREAIFKKFYRLNKGDDTIPGTGLGLALSKSIVELHGGNISASNRKDGKSGTIFEIRLPTETGTQKQRKPDNDQ